MGGLGVLGVGVSMILVGFIIFYGFLFFFMLVMMYDDKNKKVVNIIEDFFIKVFFLLGLGYIRY